MQQAGGGARGTGSGALHRERAGLRHRRRGTPGSPGRRGTNRRGTGEPAPRRHAGTTHGRGARHPRPRRGTGHGAPLADAAERHGIPGPQPDHRRVGCRLRGRRVARQRRVARHGALRRRLRPFGNGRTGTRHGRHVIGDEPPDPQPQGATRNDRRRYCPRTDVGARPGTGSIPGKTVHAGAYARRSWVAGLFPHGRPAGGGNPRGTERTGSG